MSTKTTKYILIAVKSESEYGTDAFSGTPAAGDWIAAYADSTVNSPRQIINDTTVRPFASGLEHQSVGSHTELTINLPLTGKDSAAGDPPNGLDALFQAAGFKETVVASTSATYTPETFHTSSNAPSATVYVAWYQTDGTVRTQVVTGCRFNCTLSATDGEPVRLSFEGMGLYSEKDAASVAAPSNPSSYSGNKPQLLSQGLTFKIGATAFPVTDYEFSTNWSLEEDRNLSGSNSLDSVDLIRGDGENMNGSVNFRGSAELETALTNYRADTGMAFEAVFTNGTDTVTIESPKAQFESVDESQGNIYSHSCPFKLSADSGDDEISIAFT